MTQKTYWHLLANKRAPSDYEVLTSRLLYYPGRGFEVETPLAAWYRDHQERSPLASSSFDRFSDPRETTYARHVGLAWTRETFVDGLLESIEASGYDAGLSARWRDVLARVFAVLRYPFHGLMMIASYVGQMAPSGRITVAALFQAADELRRVQRIAYRVAQLRAAHPGFAEDSRALWERDPMWQPLRRAVEELLVAYDWGEAFAGLNLCLKPIVDRLFMVELASLARREGDPLLGEILFSFDEDCRWHRRWSEALVRFAIEDRPENREVLARWIDRWTPPAMRAAEAFAPLLGGGAVAAVQGAHTRYLDGMGLLSPAAPST